MTTTRARREPGGPEAKEWENSGLVAIGTLKPGTVFEDIDGDVWRVLGPSGKNTRLAAPYIPDVLENSTSEWLHFVNDERVCVIPDGMVVPFTKEASSKC
jgi:hypothetical protein